MPERFILRHGGARRMWTNVVLYDTSAEMRRAAMRHRPTSDPKAMEEAGGCFQCANGIHPSYLGIIRFSREFLTAAAVVHESVHAALVYVQKLKNVRHLHLDAWCDGETVIDNEEELAYAVHGISAALLEQFNLLRVDIA